MKRLQSFYRASGVALVTGLMAVQAQAAIDTAELTAAKGDAIAVATIVLGILIAIAAFKYVRRAL